MEQLEGEIAIIEGNIENLRNSLLHENVESKQIILRKELDIFLEKEKQLKEKLATLQKETRDQFMHRIRKIRDQEYKVQKDNIFNNAWEDAENTVFQIVCLKPTEMKAIFQLKENFTWIHDLSHVRNNMIPLNPGIVTPKKRDKESNQIVPIRFYVSKFYENQKFIEKAKKYYKNYYINIEINKVELKKKNYRIYLEIYDKENFLKEINTINTNK